MPLQYPHFVGTIDSFVDRYIFLPFGHLVMNCDKRPTLVGPPHDDWEPIGRGWFWGLPECNQNRCRLNDFSFGLDGEIMSLAPNSHFNQCQSGHRKCKDIKGQFCRMGFATQTDANFYAMKILERYSAIRAALACRFPCLVLDEAQDTSDIQMRIMDLLVDGGCRDMALVGDPDQCIYEWRRASPQVFITKCRECESDTRPLMESWRSSQPICDFFSRVSSLGQTPRAVNPTCCSHPFVPEIWGVRDNNYQDILDRFISLCRTNGITLPADIVVLCRGRELLHELLGPGQIHTTLKPWKDQDDENIAKSKFLSDQGMHTEGLRLLEKTIFRLIERFESSIDVESMQETIRRRYGFVRWRRELSTFLAALPSTNFVRIGDWMSKPNAVLPFLNSRLSQTIKRDRRPRIYSELKFGDVFPLPKRSETDRYRVGTIHSVKGETFEAVLFIAKHKGANGMTYASILKSNIEENEEIRALYVAITRPRRILVLAVPLEDLSVWKARFGVI